MITEVKNAFKARLDANTWLDDTTRQRSKDKVDAITQMVAYPDQIDNATYLNELYEEVSCTYIHTASETLFWKCIVPQN